MYSYESNEHYENKIADLEDEIQWLNQELRAAYKEIDRLESKVQYSPGYGSNYDYD
jgi:prefoldin subunit 5